MISIVCPTIAGREYSLERTRRSYDAWTDDFEFVVVRDRPTCGEAWNVGMEEARGDLIHLTADDIEATEGWWQAGSHWVEAGYLPCPRVLNPDGSLQSCGSDDQEHENGTPSDLARVPFFSREQMVAIYPILPIHYATDYWVTHRAREAGWPTVVVREMVFVHHFAPEGRLDARLMDDMRAFWEAASRPGAPRPG